MKIGTRGVMAAICLLVSGVGARAEPLADFDALVKRCAEAFDSRPAIEVVYAAPAQSWVKRIYAPAKVVYYVRKTASSVSPFVGFVEITELASAQRSDDEESARALDVSMEENAMRSVRRINFAYQVNAWTVLGGSSSLEVKRDAGEKFSGVRSSRLSRDAVLEFQGPIANCVSSNRY